jgi:hypothetical protein
VLNGGIIGTLLDCHSNWCAATTLMREQGLDEAAVTVTSEFHVKLRRPAPSDKEVLLTARPVEVDGNRVTVNAQLEGGGEICATCRAVLVKVEEGHPPTAGGGRPWLGLIGEWQFVDPVSEERLEPYVHRSRSAANWLSLSEMDRRAHPCPGALVGSSP